MTYIVLCIEVMGHIKFIEVIKEAVKTSECHLTHGQHVVQRVESNRGHKVTYSTILTKYCMS